jgi:NAD-dependent deacetylase
MKKMVVLTGAGVSAESGIKTFRDSGGLWEEYDVMEVASIEGWRKNPELVLRFYNERRKQLKDTQPHQAHTGLAELEKKYDVHIITQNIDNLHERGGSSKVLHLHGIITEARSSLDPSLVYDIGLKDINPGDLCEKGSQLRPNIVWFGEAVPALDKAMTLSMQADIFVVVGSSLNVYPAAGLINYTPPDIPIYVIDPKEVNVTRNNITFICEKASTGVQKLKKLLSENI